MLFQIKSYLQFLWHSKNEHAVHSPFVFNLVTKCFYDRKNKEEYAVLKQYERSFLQNENSNKKGVLSFNAATLLFRLSNYFKPHTILEIGSLDGLATKALSLGWPQANLNSFEKNKKDYLISKPQVDKLKISKLEIENISTACKIKSNTFLDVPNDLIYFNGTDLGSVLLTSFELILSNVSNNSVCVFNGIHHSKASKEAWESIKNNSAVSVSIDTFTFGFVFFRKEQSKQHFYIRI
jgi:hypothetical protein